MNLWLIKELPKNPLDIIKYWNQYKYYIQDIFSNKQSWQCHINAEENFYDGYTNNDFKRGSLVRVLYLLGVIRKSRLNQEGTPVDDRTYWIW